MSQPGAPRTFRYYDLIMAAFVCVLLCSNLIGVSKVTEVAGIQFDVGNLFFPLSYLFGDILTEVYGYARSRRVVWVGFGAMVFASVVSVLVVNLPPATGWSGQEVIEKAFGSTWRIALASLMGFWAGEFTNAFTLAKLKIAFNGKKLWIRTIGSTVVGELVDSLIFFPLAFYGIWPNDLLLTVMVTSYFVKVGWEVVATPLTYRVVNALKRAEHEDYFDRETNFNPFKLAVQA